MTLLELWEELSAELEHCDCGGGGDTNHYHCTGCGKVGGMMSFCTQGPDGRCIGPETERRKFWEDRRAKEIEFERRLREADTAKAEGRF